MSMSKIRKISEFQHSIPFLNSEEQFGLIYNDFLDSNLGKIYQAIPWDALTKVFTIEKSHKGPDCIFSPKGKIALMFLKNYACCSDQRLIEQLNGNVHYQIFCDLYLSPGQKLKSFKIVSQVRCELAELLNIENTQKALAQYWLPFMNELNKATTDATCYESSVRYPTDQKLLWESVEWCYGQMNVICKYLKVRKSRTKYNKWKNRYYQYSRKRKRSKKERRALTRSLLLLLDKLLKELYQLSDQNTNLEMPDKYYQRIVILTKVYEQQYNLFTTGEKPSDRIVSLAKSYLRPIVRGKEIKSVEFGAKVNKVQIDGINFIDMIDFNAFNEGTRFKASVQLIQELTHTKLKVMGADAIYGTNKNRKFATANNIQTDFVRKGRAGKHEGHRKLLSSMITKERASRLEGSFGKEKEHYHLKTIKARTQKTEILWIFFGIHVANALEIGRRMSELNVLKTAS